MYAFSIEMRTTEIGVPLDGAHISTDFAGILKNNKSYTVRLQFYTFLVRENYARDFWILVLYGSLT